LFFCFFVSSIRNFQKAVKSFCKSIEQLARVQDRFQREVAKRSLELDAKLSKVNVQVRANKRNAQKKKEKVLRQGEKVAKALEDKYAAPLFTMATNVQRTRAYFSEVMLKYWELADKASCTVYNQFIELDEQLSHEAVNIDFSGLSMLHDKLSQNGARVPPLEHVIIPKEIRVMPKMIYTPKRELLRMGRLVANKDDQAAATAAAASSSSSKSADVAAPTSPSSSAADEQELQRLRGENEKLQRQVRLVKMTLQNEVQENARLRERLSQYEPDDDDDDSSDDSD
jgi:archaellum component FlaF (FlaF/FlaG flagellin family)